MTRSSRIFGRSIRWFSLGLFLVVGTVWEGGLEALGGALAPSGAVAWHPGTPDGRRALRAPVQGKSLDRAKEAAAKEEALRRLWSETAVATVGLLETQHYLKRAVDGDGSRRALERFLETLDPARMHFLESDVVEFRERYGGGLGQELKEGRFDAVEAIFGRLKERCVEVRPLVEELLEGAWDFREPWTVELSRMHAAWPKDAVERRRLWREQLGAEILNEVLDGMSVDRARGRARKRHWESGEVMLKAGLGERVAWALAGVAKAYDAHSDYLTREEFEAEDNDVRLSRVGIGITVDGDPMGVRVVGMLPGGPAERDGRLRVNDRIVAVADGTGPFQELEALPFAKAMSLLRGEKGTLVKLKVQPAREEDPARRMVIALHRDEMRSSEGEAYGKLVEWTE
ncbi:MAG: Periplasmic protease, partial [Verrucomicrobiota bacterium]